MVSYSLLWCAFAHVRIYWAILSNKYYYRTYREKRNRITNFFLRHIWWWIPTYSCRFLQWRHIFLQSIKTWLPRQLLALCTMAESEESVPSVSSAGSTSLDAVASTSNASVDYLVVSNRSAIFPPSVSQNCSQILYL